MRNEVHKGIQHIIPAYTVSLYEILSTVVDTMRNNNKIKYVQNIRKELVCIGS